jgi:hypothetical protein
VAAVPGAGIRVTRVSADYREIDVRLKPGLVNRNHVGTHVGGSRFAMTEPFHALMMMHSLGRDDIVRDKAGAIRFVKPGRGAVHARFRLDPETVVRAREATAGGAKHEPTFTIDIVDRTGEVIAAVDKTLHIRRHEPSRSAAPAGPVA